MIDGFAAWVVRLTLGLCVGWGVLAPVAAQEAGGSEAPLQATATAMRKSLALPEQPATFRWKGSAAGLSPWIEAELREQLRWQLTDFEQGPRFEQAFEAARHALAAVTVCRVRPDGSLFALDMDAARRVAGRGEVRDFVEPGPVLQLAVAAEVARAALEARYDLARRRAACRDAEEFLALQAVTEGRVLWLTRKAVGALGIEASLPLLAERCLLAPDTAPDPGLRLAVQLVVRQRRRAAVLGLAFFDTLEAKQLLDAEKVVFTNPPRQLDWVARPEVYLHAGRSEREPLPDVLKRLEKALGNPGWTAAQQPWTPDMLRQAGTILGQKERVERVLGKWEEGRSLVWWRKPAGAGGATGQQVAVGVVCFQDAAGAQAYLGLAADLQRKQDELLGGCPGGGRVLESRSRSVQVKGADEAAAAEKRLQLAPGTEPVPVSQVWVRTGPRVLEFTWYGVPADLSWAERVHGLLGTGK
jgi:hypothetical protein